MTEIKFKRDTSFRKQFFVPNSFAHPAKMDAQLLIWIVEKYTQPGETILDPMAGSGTMMLACTLGRNCVLVELEDKFCKMTADNWSEVRMRPQLGYSMGDCQIIQGDARQLDGLVDKIVTSPPYAEQMGTPKCGIDWTKGKGGRDKSSEPAYNPESNFPSNLLAYSESKDNIGNLPYGEIDKCIFSPPYAEVNQMPRNNPDPTADKQGRDNIGKQYSDDANNIGNLPYGQIDKIVTSPPYEGTTGEGKEIGSEGHAIGPFHYGNAQGNIGNLKSGSYLQAMLEVYQQCHKVLKPDGMMILVTKNFIRNKQVVRLDTDTIKLCEQAGFTYLERHYRKLPAQSFWRVIYHQKHPEVEQILSEDVMVLQKVENLHS